MKQIELKIVNPAIAEFLPEYGTEGAAAVDLRAIVNENTNRSWSSELYGGWVCEVPAGKTVMIRTGIAIHIADPSICAMILPRSGLGSRDGIILGNGTGLIDSDYQGELQVAVWNRSNKPFTIRHLDRIAQMVFVPVVQAKFNVVQEFGQSSARGSGGFGSTGIA